MTEFGTAVIIPEVSPTFIAQHSEDTSADAEISTRHLDRLRRVLQNGQKPYHVLDSTSDIDVNGTKPLAQIFVENEASKISTNRSRSSLNSVDYFCFVSPERIVRVAGNSDGAPVRGGSAHGVRFVRLGTQRGQLLDSAVKTFDKNPSTAVMELVNMCEIEKRGIDTLTPIGAIIDTGKKGDDEPLGFLITQTESIRSMDRLRMFRLGYQHLTNKPEEYEDYLGYLGQTGSVLSQMHLKGIFHADAQIKNFAIRDTGQVIPIDFESASIFNREFFATNSERFVLESSRNLIVLLNSLMGDKKGSIPFFNGLSKERLWNAFNTAIFSYYEGEFETQLLGMAESGKLTKSSFGKGSDALDQIRESVKQYALEYSSNPGHVSPGK